MCSVLEPGWAVSNSNHNFQLVKRRGAVPSCGRPQRVVAMCNTSGCHWVCMEASRHTRRITVYDTLGGKHTSFVQRFKRFLVHVWPEHPMRTMRVGRVPWQRDGSSCGPLVCEVADRLVCGGDTRHIAVTARAVRRLRRRVLHGVLRLAG